MTKFIQYQPKGKTRFTLWLDSNIVKMAKSRGVLEDLSFSKATEKALREYGSKTNLRDTASEVSSFINAGGKKL